MAWPDIVGTNHTSSFQIDAGSPDLNHYYSRWVNGYVDDTTLHVVRECVGTIASPAADKGTYYLQFDLTDGTLTSTSTVNAANIINLNYHAPRVAVNPSDGRIWVVYAQAGGVGSSQNAQLTSGTIKTRYSDDSGATWSSEITLDSAQFRAPSIDFGAGDAGFIVGYDTDNHEYAAFEYQGGTTWGSRVTISNPSATPYLEFTDVSVSDSGTAVAIVDNTDASTNAKAGYIYYNGSSWGGFTSIVTWNFTNAGIHWPHVQWNAARSTWYGIVGEASGNGSAERFSISSGGSLLESSAATFTTPLGSGTWERSMSAYTDRAGNLHVFNSASLIGEQYYMWTLADETWSTPVVLGWQTQKTDHGESSQPVGVYHGIVAVSDDGDGMIVYNGDESEDGSSNADLWGGWAEDLVTLPPVGDVGEVGCFVGLTTYEKAGDTRLIAYAGSGIYHDGNSYEFIGNRIGVGAFEPTPDFAVFEDLLIIADGENPLKSWNMVDASTSEITGAPALAGMEVARNRIWGWRNSAPRRILWSGLRDETDWILDDGATVLETDPGFLVIDELPQGEPITAMKEFFGRRYVFSRTGIAVITGDTNAVDALANGIEGFRVSKVQGTIGCEANLTVVDIGTDLIFMSRKGVHSLLTTEKFGAVEEAYLSAPIQDFFTSLDPMLLSKCKATHYRRKNWYVLTVPRASDGAMKSILIYDYAQKLWAIWDFDYEICSVHARLNPMTLTEELLLGTNKGYVGVADQGSSYDFIAASEHTSKVRSMWLSGDTVRGYKHFVRGIVHISRPANGDIVGTYQVDAGDTRSFTLNQNPHNAVTIGNAKIGSSKIGRSGSAPVHSDFLIHERGQSLRVELTTPTGPSNISGVELEVTPGSYRADTRK